VKYFLCVLGMVFIIEGLPYFAFPDKIKLYLAKLLEMPDSTLRILGLIGMATGLILVYLGRT
jgi:uncharacterized protein